MHLRRDPAYAAAALTVFVRELASRFGGHQVCTVGKVDLHPNLTNVVPSRAVLTLDVRNTDEAVLQRAEAEIEAFCKELAAREKVTITRRRLARFEPVVFDERVVEMVERIALARAIETDLALVNDPAWRPSLSTLDAD